MGFSSWLFDTHRFVSPWQCGAWSRELGLVYVVSDLALFFAYAAFAYLLASFVRRSADVVFPRVSLLVAAFILSRGATHLLDATMFFWPAYRLGGLAQAITAVASLSAVVAFVLLLPRALRLPALAKTNDELASEVVTRKAAEAQLRRSEARYRSLVDATSSVLWTADARGEQQTLSPSWSSFTGQTFEDARGFGFLEAVHVQHRARFTSEWQMGIAAQRAFEIEAPIYHAASAGHRTCVVRAAPVLAERGEVIEWVASVHDIEDRRQAERERREIERRVHESRRMESLGVLAGGIAHDFNNLLVGVMGHADWMTRRLPADSPLHDNVGRILGSAERAAQLCKQMLAYAGRAQLVAEPVDISAVTREMHGLLSSLVPAGVRLSLQAAPELPAVEADPAQLRQVLVSLVTNASEALESAAQKLAANAAPPHASEPPTLRAVPDGEPRGTIEVRTGVRFFSQRELARTRLGGSCAEGEYVYFEVRDDGPGVSPEVLPRMFDPFFSTKFTGRGLSLAAVLGVVRSHHGTIDVWSNLGEGTRIRVLLPAVANRAARTLTPSLQARRVEGTVLVVDDDPEVRELARLALEDAGAHVLLAGGGQEAVETLRANPAGVDLALVDLTMPGMDGATTMRLLRKEQSALRVILTSGYTAEDVRERVGEPNAEAFLQKPWRPSELVTKIAAALAEPRAQRYA